MRKSSVEHPKNKPIKPYCRSPLLPVGFGGYGLPFEAVEECRWGAYSCSIVEQQQRLVCLRRVDYYGGVVAGEVFADFKRFWEACARADAADVVLMKSAP